MLNFGQFSRRQPDFSQPVQEGGFRVILPFWGYAAYSAFTCKKVYLQFGGRDGQFVQRGGTGFGLAYCLI